MGCWPAWFFRAVCFVVLLLIQGDLSAGFINNTAVNFRDAPSISGTILMRLPYGTECEVLAVEGDWANVRLDDTPETKGYVSARLVSAGVFEKSKRDTYLMVALEQQLLAATSIADTRRHEIDNVPDPDIMAEDPAAIREIRESLERWLYWERTAPLKYKLWMAALADRENVYGPTPAAILATSPAFHLGVEGLEGHQEERSKHPLRLPVERQSFFTEPPQHLYVTEARVTPDGIELPRPEVAFQWLLSISFLEGQTVGLERRDGKLVYVSAGQTDFISIKGTRSVPIKRRGQLEYVPTEQKLSIKSLRGPADLEPGASLSLFFAPSDLLKRLETRAAINVATSTRRYGDPIAQQMGDIRAATLEYDLNLDGVLDIIQADENCPEDVGDSRDRVDYYNVKGSWLTKLRWRTWCLSE